MSSPALFILCCYALTLSLVGCAPGETQPTASVAPKTGAHGSVSRDNTSNGTAPQDGTKDQVTSVHIDSKMEEIIHSVVDQDASASDMMSLPNDLVINALRSNIETLQDQLDFCEEGLMERISPHGVDRRSNYANDNDDRRDNHAVDGSSRRVTPSVNDASQENDDSKHSDKLGQRVQRHKRSAASRDRHQGQGRSVHALARVVVERLSSRISYLKKSLAECYVVYSKWNIRHS